MNTLNKALIASILALGSAAAQAELPDYPSNVMGSTVTKATNSESAMAVRAAVRTPSQSPYVMQGEVLVDNPAYQPPATKAARMNVAQIRALLAQQSATVSF